MASNKAKFVYVTYINSSPEKVFNALVDGEVLKQYWWRHNNVSDWKVGSRWEHRDFDNPKLVDIVGKVLEYNPPHRLVVTWSEPSDEGKPEKTSRVTFDIKPYMDSVRLTVIHDELEPGSTMERDISLGWPAVLSSLKTILETGKPLQFSMERGEGPPPE